MFFKNRYGQHLPNKAGFLHDYATKCNLSPGTSVDCPELSFFRLSLASFIIGLFWIIVQLHAYVVWLRGDEKALLLVAVIASCIAIRFSDQIPINIQHKSSSIEKICWVFLLFLVTVLVAYLIFSEPSLVSLQFDEIPGALRLKVAAGAIIFLALAPLYFPLIGVRVETIRSYRVFYITSFGIVCVLCRSISFVYYTCGPNFSHSVLACHGLGIADIGGTTLNAIHAVEKGINPYTIDVQGDYTHVSHRGYTYWPMMIAIYTPLVSLFTTGWGAMRLTNYALDMMTATLIIVLVCRRSGWLCGVLAASLYLSLPMLPTRLYQMADTDLAPTVLLLAALTLYQARPGLAGLMVGLSVSAKFIPGLLMAVCCFPEFRRSHYVAGFAVGMVPVIAFCLLAPSEFIDNTMWVLASTPDDSSWLHGAPFYLMAAMRVAFVLLIVAVSFVIISRRPDLFDRCTLYVICVIAALLTSRAHNNYMLWWIPFFCILLSSPLSRILALPGQRANIAGNV